MWSKDTTLFTNCTLTQATKIQISLGGGRFDLGRTSEGLSIFDNRAGPPLETEVHDPGYSIQEGVSQRFH